jgi:hypothetical protein
MKNFQKIIKYLQLKGLFMPILTEITTVKHKIIDFIKRPFVAIIFIILIAFVTYSLFNIHGDKQTKITEISGKMETLENNAKNNFHAKYDSVALPAEMVYMGEVNAVNQIKTDPKYQALQQELTTLENDKASITLAQTVLLILLGLIIIPVMTGGALYLCTKFNFIEFLLKEPGKVHRDKYNDKIIVDQVSDDYNTAISASIVEFLGVVFKCYTILYVIIIGLYIYVANK